MVTTDLRNQKEEREPLDRNDPLSYLSRENYTKIYDELRAHINRVSVVVPPMGSKDKVLIDNFHDKIRKFIYQKCNLTTFATSSSLEMEDRISIVVNDMAALMRGFGPLQPYMEMEGIEEIIVRQGSVLIEKEGRIMKAIDNSDNPLDRATINEQFRILAQRISDIGHVAVSETKPYAVTTVPETQDRCGVIVPPLSQDYVSINIRVFPKRRPYSLEDLQTRGAFANVNEIDSIYARKKGVQRKKNPFFEFIKEEQARKDAAGKFDPNDPSKTVYHIGREGRLQKLLDSIEDDESRKNFERFSKEVGDKVAMFLAYTAYYNLATILAAGEFSSGKTTLLNAMGYFIREDVQPVVLEDFFELRIPHKYIMRCVTNKMFDQGEILNVVLTRMRPDLIVVGELVEKGQSFEFLNASNLGKKAWATIHSNSGRAALIRLENLATVGEYSPYEIRRRVVNAIDMVVHLAHDGRDRFVNEIVLVDSNLNDKGDYSTRPIYESSRRPKRQEMLINLWDGISQQD